MLCTWRTSSLPHTHLPTHPTHTNPTHPHTHPTHAVTPWHGMACIWLLTCAGHGHLVYIVTAAPPSLCENCDGLADAVPRAWSPPQVVPVVTPRATIGSGISVFCQRNRSMPLPLPCGPCLSIPPPPLPLPSLSPPT